MSFCLCTLGVKEGSIDDLVFDTLIPKPIIQRYLNLLMEHRRIILSGPSGTGKSYLATKLAYFIISKTGREVTDTNLASFNVDQKSSKVCISILGGIHFKWFLLCPIQSLDFVLGVY